MIRRKKYKLWNKLIQYRPELSFRRKIVKSLEKFSFRSPRYQYTSSNGWLLKRCELQPQMLKDHLGIEESEQNQNLHKEKESKGSCELI